GHEFRVHTVRDCSFSKVVWLSLVPIQNQNRNKYVFPNSHNSVQVIADTNISWMRNHLRTISTDCNNNPQVTASHWSVLEEGWIKVNMDGPVSPFRSSASIGGVFRDMNGSWLCGFLMRLGGDIIFKVEARAIFKGLNLAWDKGFRQLELECDNALLVETILVGGAADSNLTELRLIYRLLNRNWKVHIRHIPRTHNKVADHLAKCTATSFMKQQLIEEPPHLVRDLILTDCN
ncbi:hypothetical protein Goari_024069, partial [Gossypium aridum]|nr:hypothetical protein [Gossypium aridum]